MIQPTLKWPPCEGRARHGARPPGILQNPPQAVIIRVRDAGMVNYILLYKIRRVVKKIIKDKISDDEIATTPKSCIGCLADDISWEVYYLLKEREEKDGPPASES
jgi:hypothetical protein